MQLGISSYTYVWSAGVPGYEQPDPPLSVWDLLEKSIQLGVRVIQFADNLSLGQLSEEERRHFADRAKALGILIEVGTAGIDPSGLLDGLKLAKQFESPILRTLLDAKGHEPTVDEVVLKLKEIEPEFSRPNVILAIENHDRFKSATLREIVERIDSRHVGICFDTANSIGCLESAEQVLSTLGPHIVNVHIKDYCVFRPTHLKGFIVEGRTAGQGQLDIPQILSQLTELGREPNVILELWPPPQATLAESVALECRWAEEGIRYLRRFVTG